VCKICSEEGERVRARYAARKVRECDTARKVREGVKEMNQVIKVSM
jgi:hypothetical protein